MNRARGIVDKNATGKKVLWLFVLTNLVYGFMLIVTIPKTMHFSNGMKLLDMMPMGYDPEYIKLLFNTLGEEGRHVYLYHQLPVDLIYPFLFGISYSLMIGYFLKKINRSDSSLFYLCFLPIIAGIADYLENFGIITMLNSFPDLSRIAMVLTNVFTITKSMATTVFFVALIIILLMLGVDWIKQRNTRTSNV